MDAICNIVLGGSLITVGLMFIYVGVGLVVF